LKLIPLIGATTLAAANLSAQAVGPGTLGAIDNTPVVVGGTMPAGLLFDVYSFSLLNPGMLSGIATSLELLPALSISGFSAVLQDANFTTIGKDASPVDGFSFTGLAAGSYALTFVGFAAGTLGGSYGGSIFATTVSEPENYAMFLAGLGVIGLVVARRAKRE
jgi:hypothetical protein